MRLGVRIILLAEAGPTRSNGLSATSVASTEILGSSLLQHVVNHLRSEGFDDIVAVTDIEDGLPFNVSAAHVLRTRAGEVISGAMETFERAVDDGVSALLVMRVSGYFELDWQALLRHHLASGLRVTQVWNHELPSPLEIFAVSATRGLSLHSVLQGRQVRVGHFFTNEKSYVKPLTGAVALRDLTWDALHLRCGLRPAGEQIRPGVWVAAYSRVDRTARLVAPVYIGRWTKVRAGAVITRGTSLEHHCLIDCGTVVEDSSMLPYSQIGPCLDVCHAVVSNRQIFRLGHNVATRIHDSKLISVGSPNAGLRTLATAASFFSFLSGRLFQGLLNSSSDGLEGLPATAASEGFRTTNGFNPGSKNDIPELPAGLAVMRRYGNQ